MNKQETENNVTVQHETHIKWVLNSDTSRFQPADVTNTSAARLSICKALVCICTCNTALRIVLVRVCVRAHVNVWYSTICVFILKKPAAPYPVYIFLIRTAEVSADQAIDNAPGDTNKVYIHLLILSIESRWVAQYWVMAGIFYFPIWKIF